jgi:hypothetical protein
MRNLLLLLLVPGCFSTIDASSRSHLGAEQSGAVTNHPMTETAVEVTRLFSVRGYALADQHVDAPNGERRLKFTKTVRFPADADASLAPDQLGSVFYAWVTPTQAGSTVSLLGKPTLGGVEPCTDDGIVLPCSQLTVQKTFADIYMGGQTEAQVAHGVLAELELEGFAVSATPATAPLPTGDPAALACKAKRHDLLVTAVASKDPAEKRAILDDLPGC